MIKKILSIKNLGKFKDYSAVGDVELKKMTLIYSENGRGKTTLAAIFKSLGHQEPALIKGRESLKGTGHPAISIRLDADITEFKDSKWTKPYPNIEVFDSGFVSDNVYVGQHVPLDNRREHYRFVIGEEGVKLSKRVDELADEIRRKDTAVKEKANEIMKHAVGTISIDDFASLPSSQNVDEKIAEQEQFVQTLQGAKDVKDHDVLSELTLPTISRDALERTLGKTLPDMTAEVQERISKHISECMDEKGEPWVEQGVGYIKGDKCPFCGLPLEKSEFVMLYRKYFSEEYDNLKKEISSLMNSLQNDFSPETVMALQKSILSNLSNLEFWKQHASVEIADVDFEATKQSIQRLLTSLSTLFQRKKDAPSELIQMSDEVSKAIDAYEDMLKSVDEYNSKVNTSNSCIEAKKKETESGDLFKATSELEKLRNIKSRHEKECATLLNEYENIKDLKEKLREEKEKNKKELDNFSSKLFSEYESGINGFLEKMGAGFRITGTQTSFSGGRPSSEFEIHIDGKNIKLGNEKTPDDKPSFRNTLSDGDKSALAFAFFLSRLALDVTLQDKTVIIDDPLTSLDENRKTVTEQEVVKLAEEAAQVVLLSHDPFFLDEVRTKCARNSIEINLQKIIRVGDDSRLECWDPTLDLLDPTIKDYLKLSDYIERGSSGDLRDVARSIRTLLEGKLRRQFPKHIRATDWLGDMISKIRASEAPPLNMVKDQATELSELNEYSSRYHHGPSNNADSEPINDGELKPFVQRSLKLYHSF